MSTQNNLIIVTNTAKQCGVEIIYGPISILILLYNMDMNGHVPYILHAFSFMSMSKEKNEIIIKKLTFYENTHVNIVHFHFLGIMLLCIISDDD